MAENKEDEIAETAREVISGFSNEKAAPWIMISIFGVICVALAYIFSPIYKDLEQQKHESDKYIIDTFNSQLKNTTATIMKFDATLVNVNNNLSNLKTQIEDTRTEQKNIRESIKEHERRLTRIEIMLGKKNNAE